MLLFICSGLANCPSGEGYSTKALLGKCTMGDPEGGRCTIKSLTLFLETIIFYFPTLYLIENGSVNELVLIRHHKKSQRQIKYIKIMN